MAFFALLKESFQASLLYVSIFLVVLLWYFLKLKSEKRKSNLPPNPPKLPIIGNLHQLGNMPHLSFQCLAERVAFGRDFSAGGEYDRHGFQKTLEEFHVLLGGISIGDFFPSMEFIHNFTGMKSRLQNIFGRYDKLFDQLLAEHQNPKRDKVEHKDLIDVLLDIQKNDSDEIPLTTDNIKAIILDLFAGGTDTTYITLDWGMTELIMNPKVMKRAQAEVRSIVGERRVVLVSDLHQLHYIKAVIKEIFRLHPPAPILAPRESMEEVNIDGYTIPAKTRFYVNAWAIGRDPESWENPDVFEPERFMGSTVDFKGQHFELIPFGAGRRSCPAITFGTASVELALAQLLHSFDWELPHGITAKDLDITEVFGITMHRTADLIVIAKPCFPLDHANDNPKI
uniref:Cytochrome P450 n=1 Tax=Fagus sylvatica TaxID=28930 RepID=A0A2N9ISN7_FAGSY